MIISHREKKSDPDRDELTFEEMSRDYRLIISSDFMMGFFDKIFLIDIQQ